MAKPTNNPKIKNNKTGLILSLVLTVLTFSPLFLDYEAGVVSQLVKCFAVICAHSLIVTWIFKTNYSRLIKILLLSISFWGSYFALMGYLFLDENFVGEGEGWESAILAYFTIIYILPGFLAQVFLVLSKRFIVLANIVIILQALILLPILNESLGNPWGDPNIPAATTEIITEDSVPSDSAQPYENLQLKI